jgi:hypothetical protein
VGFAETAGAREYRLRIRQGAEAHEFTVIVSHEAFLSHRLRYQDGPEVCFMKLQRALVDGAGALPTGALAVTEADLEAFKTAHAPKAKTRRRPPIDLR